MHHVDDPAYMTPFDPSTLLEAGRLRAFGPKRERRRWRPFSPGEFFVCRSVSY